jgi:N-glycosidase YbiA
MSLNFTKDEFENAKRDGNIVTFYSKSKNKDAQYLSNFQICNLIIDNVSYPSVEHYFQKEKYNFSKGNKDSIPNFDIMTASQAKSAGSRGGMNKYGFSLDIITWEDQKVNIMRKALNCRWIQDEKFKYIVSKFRKDGKLLLHFEFGKNPIWGGKVLKNGNLEGINILGDIIMDIYEQNLSSLIL